MAKLLKFSVLIIVLLMATWWITNTLYGAKQKEIQYRAYEDFVARVGAFPYTAPEAVKNRILSNGLKLSLGLTKQEVLDFLGEPDFERKISTMTNKFIGWSWSYYLYASSLVANERSDKRVDIFFNKKGIAYWIVPLNINVLVVKGSPTHTD